MKMKELTLGQDLYVVEWRLMIRGKHFTWYLQTVRTESQLSVLLPYLPSTYDVSVTGIPRGRGTLPPWGRNSGVTLSITTDGGIGGLASVVAVWLLLPETACVQNIPVGSDSLLQMPSFALHFRVCFILL